jgi:hypothetical protein
MKKIKSLQQIVTILLTIAVVVGVSGVTPPEVKNVPQAKAATYYFRSGYYMGDGGTSNPITGLGFQPQFVMTKATSTIGTGVVWTTSQIKTDSANRTCFFTATACQNTTNYMSLNSDGFTLLNATEGNTADIRYSWIAAAGSDCSASGYFCVNKYTATGSAQNVTSVGFQPTFVLVKKYTTGTSSAQRAAVFATDTMVATESCQLINVNCGTTDITGFLSNGFTIGTGLNANDAGGADDTYYYIAFRDQTGIFNTGTYTVGGVEADDTSISGFGGSATPDAVWVKCRTTVTPQNATWLIKENYGDKGQMLSDTVAAVNQIQKLQTDGFEIGTADTVSIASTQYYWVAWDGSSWNAASGKFTMKTGTYTGNSVGASTQTISGVGFTPDLVIIKDVSTGLAVFKTKMMSDSGTTGSTLANYMGTNVAGLQDCIRSFNSDGFVIGQSTVCNNNTVVFYYEAFGNAYDPYDRAGAADFAVGAYEGNAIDNDLFITNVGFQPDLVMIKYNATQYGVWTNSTMGADTTDYFHGAATAANFVQSLDADGFSVGSGTPVNTSSTAVFHYWFAFKKGSNFTSGSYSGTGTNDASKNISNIQTTPDYVWVKGASTQAGVHRSSSIPGDSTQYFTATANAANRVDQFNTLPPGFRVDNNVEVNTGAAVYYYAVWRVPVYTPEYQHWRWYDAENLSDTDLYTQRNDAGGDTTAGASIAAEDTAPTASRILYPGNVVNLRISIKDVEGKAATDVKFKLQYDTDSAFGTATDLGDNTNIALPWVYDTNNTDGFVDDDPITSAKCVLSDMTTCDDLSLTNRRGRHIEDNSTGLGQGSTLDPVANMNYEFEFEFNPNISTALSPPVANTTYYFRVLFATNTAGSGAQTPWTVVQPSGTSGGVVSGIAISCRTAAAFDLEINASPSTVSLGDNGGSNNVSYTFSSSEKIGFWDKRGDPTKTYDVTINKWELQKLPDKIVGSDITWTSDTTALTGAYASDQAGMSTASPFAGDVGGNAYTANPGTEGKGGFFFQPKIDVTNLTGKAAGVYTSVPPIIVTIV